MSIYVLRLNANAADCLCSFWVYPCLFRRLFWCGPVVYTKRVKGQFSQQDGVEVGISPHRFSLEALIFLGMHAPPRSCLP